MPTAIFSPFLILLQECVACALTTFEKEEEKEKPLGSFLTMVAFPRLFSDDITSFVNPFFVITFEETQKNRRVLPSNSNSRNSGRGLGARLRGMQ